MWRFRLTRKKTSSRRRRQHGPAPQLVLAGVLSVLLLSSGCASCGKAVESPRTRELSPAHLAESATEAVRTPDDLSPACAVVALASVDEGPPPLLVQFTAEGLCTDAAGNYVWNFGDDTPVSHERNPVHTYTEAGNFLARVTLADPANHAEDADELAITVTAQ